MGHYVKSRPDMNYISGDWGITLDALSGAYQLYMEVGGDRFAPLGIMHEDGTATCSRGGLARNWSLADLLQIAFRAYAHVNGASGAVPIPPPAPDARFDRLKAAVEALGPFDIVQGDSIRRTTPHSGQVLNSSAAWLASAGDKAAHKIATRYAELMEALAGGVSP